MPRLVWNAASSRVTAIVRRGRLHVETRHADVMPRLRSNREGEAIHAPSPLQLERVVAWARSVHTSGTERGDMGIKAPTARYNLAVTVSRGPGQRG
jgi:hypothetical protein